MEISYSYIVYKSVPQSLWQKQVVRQIHANTGGCAGREELLRGVNGSRDIC